MFRKPREEKQVKEAWRSREHCVDCGVLGSWRGMLDGGLVGAVVGQRNVMGRTSRVVVAGARQCGKTSILEKAIYANSTAEKQYIPTVEDTYVGIVETERGTREKLRFYDTAGLDAQHRSLPQHYHALADGYVLVYSVTDSLSFQLLTDMKKDIDRHKEKKDVPIIILGNKSDLSGSSGAVDETTAERWAAGERLRVWQVNTVDRNLLLEPFMNLASRLNPQPNKTSFPQLHMGRKNKD
ncbi:NF-kappa-B inhibitor-interacting Ras-like protein 2 isoform X3 [Portunus trituberculatus]|uniref:NF-kappa-B inhibitor-interacting Ras-like protein 2 n=1 Tax=Portunus trituberculatus TaxID=210409 RepID=A0A5B7EWS8_PORTR|nr:NF-kappa-B inhibitor-interacting Ras-like protein 2 isoform X3 [Portunus trituberculatus]MPC37626.1 NF-kappa-B inhibitor-interacting Ras-like protein 2 [Portunus trituberculatus]